MKRVLVIDDDQTFRKVLCSTLSEQGFEAQEAEDGTVAIHRLCSESFDLIISDIMMPRSTGLDLLKWVKEQKIDTPIILITGFSELYETSVALSLGASGFLPKPFKRKDLLDSIQSILSGETASPQAKDLDEDYCKINIDDFVTGSSINMDIFVRLSAEKYVMIAHTGEDISPGQIQTYKNKGLSFLYVTKADFRKYIGFGSALSKAVSKSSAITRDRKLNFLRHTSEMISQHFFCNDIDKEVLNQAKGVVEASVSLLSDNPDAFKLLESLSQQSDYTYAHSVGVSFHAVLLGKKLRWLSSLTLFKLSLAGLLHDIGKKEMPKELLSKARHELSLADTTLLETHAERGMEILGQIGDIPSDVIQVALQHHENASGTGYPYRLRASKVHPLARVIAVADEFCYLSLPSFTSKGVPPRDALQRLMTFHSEKLDPPALCALFSVYGVAAPAELLEKSRKLQSQKSTG